MQDKAGAAAEACGPAIGNVKCNAFVIESAALRKAGFLSAVARQQMLTAIRIV